jgi:hypothetical protein
VADRLVFSKLAILTFLAHVYLSGCRREYSYLLQILNIVEKGNMAESTEEEEEEEEK